jgi:hypothetical protein
MSFDHQIRAIRGAVDYVRARSGRTVDGRSSFRAGKGGLDQVHDCFTHQLVHSGEGIQETVERCNNAALALEAVAVAGSELAPNIRIFNETGDQVSPTDLQQLAAEENGSDDE